MSDFEIALYTGENPQTYTRWPKRGWLHGNVTDLSMLIQSASIPPPVIEEAANRLASGVSEAAALLGDMAIAHPGAIRKICEELRQQDSEQTRRMAMTILANALVFHESLARGNEELYYVRTLDELRVNRGGVSKSAMLDDWQRILKVNYWPIFDIARRILEVIPTDTAKGLLERLVTTATELVANHLMRSHDLTGTVFQRLIADRKFLAAFYTHPSSAALLVGLAIRSDRTPGNGSWSKADDVTNLRIADFACGTGTLLSTAYRRISQLHEAAGGDAEMIHPSMMASALVGCDVLPAASHLTASMLASAHPTIKYRSGSIYDCRLRPARRWRCRAWLPRPVGPAACIRNSCHHGKGCGRYGRERARNMVNLASCIIRPSYHESALYSETLGHEGERIGVPNPMFAAFGSTVEQQREMARATDTPSQETSTTAMLAKQARFWFLQTAS